MPTTISPISGPLRKVTPTDDGNIIFLGNASEGRVGLWTVQLEPDADFAGSLLVIARSSLKDASDANAPEHPWFYRSAYLNGVAADYGVLQTAQINNSSMITIPSDGWSVGFMVACSAGSLTLYSLPIDGPSAV
jgi:hypothetical protein